MKIRIRKGSFTEEKASYFANTNHPGEVAFMV